MRKADFRLKMGFKLWLIKKLVGKQPKTPTPEFDAETREIHSEVKKKKAELRRLEMEIELEEARQELEDIRGDSLDDEPDELFKQLLLKAVNKGAAAPAQPTPQTIPDGRINLSMEQVKQFFDGLPPEQRDSVKLIGDAELRQLIKAKIPALSEETLNNCVIAARKG